MLGDFADVSSRERCIILARFDDVCWTSRTPPEARLTTKQEKTGEKEQGTENNDLCQAEIAGRTKVCRVLEPPLELAKERVQTNKVLKEEHEQKKKQERLLVLCKKSMREMGKNTRSSIGAGQENCVEEARDVEKRKRVLDTCSARRKGIDSATTVLPALLPASHQNSMELAPVYQYCMAERSQ